MLAPLFLSSLAAFVASIGLIFVAIRSDWSKRYAPLFALVASGLLLTMVLTHLAPEALQAHEYSPIVMLCGFFLGLFLHDTLRTILPGKNSVTLAAGLTPMIAIAIHSFFDGMIYTVTFARGVDTGFMATPGLILHEFPEGIVTFALLRGAGFSNRTSFLLALFAAGLTTPLGTITAIPVIYGVDPKGLELMFALSAGLLLFVSTGPLMAHMKDEHPVRSIPALALGVVLALIIASFNHSHGHDDEAEHNHDHAPSSFVEFPPYRDDH
ncbi:MAG: zinc ABC transporter permease [Ponticaulis sp.]|nr:zinc ABC transporter permease [Ponticaulis sp.]